MDEDVSQDEPGSEIGSEEKEELEEDELEEDELEEEELEEDELEEEGEEGNEIANLKKFQKQQQQLPVR